MIETDRLTRCYGSLTAVDALSIRAEPGQVLGLLGPNGAGKSTAMRMIAGFLAPTGGTARVCGHDVVREPLKAKRALGYLPEGARGAVGVGRPGRGRLEDRHDVRLAVGRGRGREDDPPAVGGTHGLEQRQGAADVGVPVVLGLLLGDADQALGREVQHRLGADVGEHRSGVV